MKGDEDTQWEQCKKKLAEITSLKCRGFGITNEVTYRVLVSSCTTNILTILSSPGPKPLAPKPKNPKRGLGLTLKSQEDSKRKDME